MCGAGENFWWGGDLIIQGGGGTKHFWDGRAGLGGGAAPSWGIVPPNPPHVGQPSTPQALKSSIMSSFAFILSGPLPPRYSLLQAELCPHGSQDTGVLHNQEQPSALRYYLSLSVYYIMHCFTQSLLNFCVFSFLKLFWLFTVIVPIPTSGY